MKLEIHRQPKYNSEFSDTLAIRLCAEAADTVSVTMVASRVGIPLRTLHRWLQKGREGDSRYAAFAAEFDKARATHEKRAMENVWEIADQTENPKMANAALRANEFILRNHFRQQYTERANNVGTHVENQLNIDVKVLNTEQKRELHRYLKAIKLGQEGSEEQAKAYLEESIDVE